MATVDADVAETFDLSSRHHEIQSGQIQSGLLQLHLVLPFLPRMLQACVASVCFKCFRCFICMLQVFHVDVAKVDRDITYVAMAIHVCCKRLFQMFQLFQMDVARVLSRCCVYFMCFKCMLHMFYLYVAKVDLVLHML